MGIQNDDTTPRPYRSTTLSNAPIEQLLRNLLDRIDSSGDQFDGAYEFLAQISLNTALPRLYTKAPVVVDDTGIKTSTRLIECPPDKRICVFDISISLDGASDLKFEYNDGTDALLPMYAPNAGQGYIKNYEHGIVLKKGESLYYTNSAAIDHGIEINFCLV